jgi:hypothetical protein
MGQGNLSAWAVSRRNSRLKWCETAYPYESVTTPGGRPTLKNRWATTASMDGDSVQVRDAFSRLGRGQLRSLLFEVSVRWTSAGAPVGALPSGKSLGAP